MKRAVVLLSGGLDSATTLALALADEFDAYALSFDYGQRHRAELQSARQVAQALGIREHRVIHLSADVFAGSALTDAAEVPKLRSEREMARGIPATYVPARNTIFLAYAIAQAEVLGSSDVFIGVNAVDYSGYPDCRPEFIVAFERVANLGTRSGVEGSYFCIHAPLIGMSKAEIVRTAQKLGLDFSLTHSCYDPAPDGRACGVCDSCQLRRKGFREAGVKDPVAYAVT
jgi:7-cyano-7-deazaguanine synthase